MFRNPANSQLLAQLHEPLPLRKLARIPTSLLRVEKVDCVPEGIQGQVQLWDSLASPDLSGAAPITFIVVILHCEDPASGSSGTVENEFSVQGLDGEGVQHPDVDLFCEERRPGGVVEEELGTVVLPHRGPWMTPGMGDILRAVT